MEVQIAETTEELSDLREEWESLESRDPHATYYVTHRFVTAWWAGHASKDGVDLHVVCIRQNQKLVGIAPLSVRTDLRGGRQVRSLRFASQGDYLTFLLDPEESTERICKSVFDHLEALETWQSVTLTNIPARSPLSHFVLKSPLNPQYKLHVENPFIDLTAFDDFDDYAARHLPSKVRKYRNKLHRERDAKFRVVRGDEPGLLDRISELHKREKQFLIEEKSRDERQSLYEDPHRAEHISKVFTGTDDVVTFVYEDAAGELLAYRTCFLHNRRLLSWNSAYDPGCSDYRIGKVIQFDILQHLFEDRFADVFDFGAGRYPWKFEWTDQFGTTYLLNLRRQGAAPGGGTPADVRRPAGQAADVPATAAPQQHVARSQSRNLTDLARQAARRAGLGKAKRRAVVGARSIARAARPPVIWYIPHPDDESIFMGGSIARSRSRRNILVLLTRGGASGARRLVSDKLDNPLSVDDFMAARLEEFHAAIVPLGLTRDDVIVHDLPDGGVEVGAVRAIITDLAKKHPRASHRTLSYLDPHADHRNTGLALREARQAGEVRDAVFHLPIPLVDEGLGSQVRLREADIEAKRTALREYERWRPKRGRYAVGKHSVSSLIKRQRRSPMERVHDARYEG